MASGGNAEDIVSVLAAIPIIDSARIVRIEEELGLFIEVQYSIKKYEGEEAFKQQYEQSASLQLKSPTAKFLGTGSSVETESRRLKSISPSGVYTLVGVRKKTTEEKPATYLHV